MDLKGTYFIDRIANQPSKCFYYNNMDRVESQDNLPWGKDIDVMQIFWYFKIKF